MATKKSKQCPVRVIIHGAARRVKVLCCFPVIIAALALPGGARGRDLK